MIFKEKTITLKNGKTAILKTPEINDAEKLLSYIKTACGETDFLYQANKEAMKYMDSINFPYTYRESGEGHIWRNWRIYLSEFAPMLFK